MVPGERIRNMKKEWEVIAEMNDEETNEPTCWYLEINSEKYGRFVWISELPDGRYAVEVRPEGEFKTLATCKSLTSAKRWGSRYIF